PRGGGPPPRAGPFRGPPLRPPPRPPLGEADPDLLLGAALGRAVVDAATKSVGQVLLAHLRVRGVVGVLVAAAVAEVTHEPGGGVAQVQRHRLRGLLLDVAAGRRPRRRNPGWLGGAR